MIFILDSYSLLTLFLSQPGWEIVRKHLDQAADDGYSHFLSGINYGEVYYNVVRRRGERAAQDVRAKIALLPVQVVMPSFEDMLLAASLKAGGGLSYADCFAAALAIKHGHPVLTGDHEFESAAHHGVKVEWLPPNR